MFALWRRDHEQGCQSQTGQWCEQYVSISVFSDSAKCMPQRQTATAKTWQSITKEDTEGDVMMCMAARRQASDSKTEFVYYLMQIYLKQNRGKADSVASVS